MTFAELYAAVERAAKQAGSKRDLVKNMINQVYLTEILNADSLFPLYWQMRLSETILSKAPATITGITQATPMVVTVANSLAVGDIVSIFDVVGMTEVNDRTFKVSVRDAASVTLTDLYDVATDSTGYTAYSSGGALNHSGKILGSNVKRVVSAAWADEDPMTEMLPENYNNLLNDNVSIPDQYIVGKYYQPTTFTEQTNIMWFDGAESQKVLQLWYENNATPLSNDTDVPQLPVEFHQAIVSGAVTRLAESKVQVEAGVVWPTLYNNQLNAIITFNQRYWQDNEFERRPGAYLLGHKGVSSGAYRS